MLKFVFFYDGRHRCMQIRFLYTKKKGASVDAPLNCSKDNMLLPLAELEE